MKAKYFLLFLMMISFAFSWAGAQDETSAPKPKSAVRTITGCLSKGDSADEFLLTGKGGSTWEVRSDKVALAEHVGHTVKATGVVSHAKMHNMKEDAKDAAVDSGMKKNDAEHGHLTISHLSMVSDSCTQ